jgi:hypothetical protein
MTDDSPHSDHPDDDGLAARLTASRPVPPAGYRGALRRRLVALGPPAPRPPHLGRLAAVHAFAGLVLLAVGAASVAGVGPLAA